MAKTEPSRIVSRNVLVLRISRKRRRSYSIEPVALALHRDDGGGLVGPGQLLAQPRDVDVDEVRAGIEIIAPHLFEDDAAAYHVTGMAGEEFQQAEFHVEQ